MEKFTFPEMHAKVAEFLRNPRINQAFKVDTNETNVPFAWHVFTAAKKCTLDKLQLSCDFPQIPDGRLVTLAGALRARAAFKLPAIEKEHVANHLLKDKVNETYVARLTQNEVDALVQSGQLPNTRQATFYAGQQIAPRIRGDIQFEIDLLKDKADLVYEYIVGDYAENIVQARAIENKVCRVDEVTNKQITSYVKTLQTWVGNEHGTLTRLFDASNSAVEKAEISPLIKQAETIYVGLGGDVEKLKKNSATRAYNINNLFVPPEQEV